MTKASKWANAGSVNDTRAWCYNRTIIFKKLSPGQLPIQFSGGIRAKHRYGILMFSILSESSNFPFEHAGRTGASTGTGKQ